MEYKNSIMSLLILISLIQTQAPHIPFHPTATPHPSIIQAFSPSIPLRHNSPTYTSYFSPNAKSIITIIRTPSLLKAYDISPSLNTIYLTRMKTPLSEEAMDDSYRSTIFTGTYGV